MNVLDENIPNSQRHILRNWRIRVQQIGHEIGRQGMKDEEIIPLLHKIAPTTFFTRDLGFYRPDLCHNNYCLVCLSVGQYETASFVRRFLRHPAFKTRGKRMGKVVRLSQTGMQIWLKHSEKPKEIIWSP
ncbi:MAG: hypothetical protein JRF56_15615 [Deltaproteobacteria bacterium]|jgi:hypothetical protein|nr:hypothetical protein [Deltaproteobacteria bacterium]